MSVHKKLIEARVNLLNTPLKKSGLNKFAGFQYFELGDFLPAITTIFNEIGLCGIVSFSADHAELTITELLKLPHESTWAGRKNSLALRTGNTSATARTKPMLVMDRSSHKLSIWVRLSGAGSWQTPWPIGDAK